MNLPKKGDTVTVEHYGSGKVIWREGRSFKVKLEVNTVDRKSYGERCITILPPISCYLSDLISIDQTAEQREFDELPKIQVGSLVRHNKFGFGRVKAIQPASVYGGFDPDKNAVIDFDYPYLQKTLYLPYANLEIISF